MSPRAVRITRVIDRLIADIASGVLVATGAAMFLLLLLGVVLRYAVQVSYPWVGEIPEILFPFFVSAGVVLSVQRGQQMAVEYLPSKLGLRAQRLLMILLQALIAVAYALVTDAILGILPIA